MHHSESIWQIDKIRSMFMIFCKIRKNQIAFHFCFQCPVFCSKNSAFKVWILYSTTRTNIAAFFHRPINSVYYYQQSVQTYVKKDSQKNICPDLEIFQMK